MLWTNQIAGFLNHVFLHKNRWNSHSFANRYKFLKIKSWLNIFWLGMFKNRCGQSSLWTLKLTVSQEWKDGINWFFAIFLVGMIKKVWPVWSWDSKIGSILEINQWIKRIFLHAGTNSGKLKVDSMIFGWTWSKNCHDLLVHETLKSVASSQWIYELNWFNAVIFGQTDILLDF